MSNAKKALLEHCRTIAVEWSRQQFSNYLQYLDAGLLRGALAAANDDDQLTLFRHHKRLKSLQPRAEALFCGALETSLNSPDTHNLGNGSTEALKELVKVFKECCGLDGIVFCQTLHPEQFIAHCEQSFQQCEFEPVAEAFALGLFHEYFLATLPDLYDQLNVAMLDKILVPSSNNGLDDWIRHLESTLNNRSLDSARRSLAQARLDELRKQRSNLERSRPKPQPSIAERWHNPYPELAQTQAKQLSNQELTEETKKLFRPLLDNPQLPRDLQAFTNRMYPLLVEAALIERELFMNPLHPHRQMIHHLVATVKHWPQTRPDEQLQMLETLRSLAQTNLQCFKMNPLLREKLLESVNHYCNEAQERINHLDIPDMSQKEMRSQVHQLLRKKMAGNTYPPAVDKLLLGPWSRVIVHHWSLGRSNSSQLKKAVSVVDLILRYCDKNTAWTKAQKSALEAQLREGLVCIETDRQKAQQMIITLHKIRLHIEKQRTATPRTRNQQIVQ